MPLLEYSSLIQLFQKQLLLEEHRIAYQQKGDLSLYLSEEDKKRLDKIMDEEAMKAQEWAIFERFKSKELLEEYQKMLDKAQIPYQIGSNQLVLPEEIQQDIYYSLSLRSSDFEVLYRLQKEEALKQGVYKSKDYYLNNFSNEELYAVLEDQQSWHQTDILAAQYILSQRGISLSDEDLELFRLQQLIEQRRPKTASKKELTRAYFFALLGGFLGIFFGLHFVYDKTTLPNGRKVYSFSERTRIEGRRILTLSLFVLILLFGIVVYSITNINF